MNPIKSAIIQFQRNCLKFNGTNQMVTVPNNGLDGFGTTMTIFAWIRRDAENWSNGGFGSFFLRTSTTGSTGQALYGFHSDSSNPLMFTHTSEAAKRPGTIRVSSPDIPVGKWFFYTGLMTSSGMRLYQNMILRHESDLVKTIGSNNNHNLYIAGPRHTYMSIGAAGIFNYDIAPSDIKEIMYRGLKGNESGLVCYYPMDKIVSGQILDASPNNFHGNLSNNPPLQRTMIR